MTSSHIAYRPDIDGLRAVAVLLVMFYHFDIEPISGGYVGVDVFFVISGYLITQILRREIVAGELSITRFYARRVRRILPALAAVLCAALAAGWILLLPFDYDALGQQAAYAAFGFSNFYFLSSTDYFARAAELQPLLHTWSLAVEEQFYVVWPFLLYVLHRLSNGSQRAVVAALLVVILASLAWSAYAVVQAPEHAFFMLPSRAWELAMGGLIVFLPPMAKRAHGRLAEAAGLILILVSAVALDEETPFPGLAAMPACLGAALLVWPKHGTEAVAKALASRPAVAIGQISYSLYLWHWPALVYFRIYTNEEMPDGLEKALLIAAAFAVSYLSWRFIELPFRRTRRMAAPLVALAATGAMCLVGVSVAITDGYAARLPSEAARIDDARAGKKQQTFTNRCGSLLKDTVKPDALEACLKRVPGSPNVLVLGDSHAGHFLSALEAEFPDARISSVVGTGCRPVIDFVATSAKEKRCSATLQGALKEIVPLRLFDVVILAARWKNGQWEKLPQTVDHLKAYVPTVIVFGQTIEYRHHLPDILASGYVPRRPIDVNASSLYAKAKVVDLSLRTVLAGTAAHYFSVIDVICSDGPKSCRTRTLNGDLFTFDYGHLTPNAARWVVSSFKGAGLALAPAR